MGMDVPFTVDADLRLGPSVQPWLRGRGADVRILRGAVPTALRLVEARRRNWECAGERVLIQAGGMRFLVEGGRTITYAAPLGIDPLDLRLFLMGTPWVALAAQRGLLPLHASAVAHGADVHAFSGPRGAGKSTLVAALSVRGHALFADDSLFLDVDLAARQARCHAYKDLKLDRTAAALANIRLGGRAGAAPSYDKHFAEAPRRSPLATGRLKALYLLTSNPARRGAVETLTGGAALQALRGSIHRPHLLAAVVGTRRIADWLVELADLVDVRVFRRDMDECDFHSGLSTIAAALPPPAPTRVGTGPARHGPRADSTPAVRGNAAVRTRPGRVGIEHLA